MRIEMTFGQYQHYQIEPTRLGQLLDSEGNVATFMGIVDRFGDYFRTEKKTEVLNVLHTRLSDAQQINENLDRVVLPFAYTAFNTIVLYVAENQKEKFIIQFNFQASALNFIVDGLSVKTCKIVDLMADVSVNGQYFLGCFDEILRLHTLACVRAWGHWDHAYCAIRDALFYTLHPELKAFLTVCHANDVQLMSDVIDALAQRGSLILTGSAQALATRIAASLNSQPTPEQLSMLKDKL